MGCAAGVAVVSPVNSESVIPLASAQLHRTSPEQTLGETGSMETDRNRFYLNVLFFQ